MKPPQPVWLYHKPEPVTIPHFVPTSLNSCSLPRTSNADAINHSGQARNHTTIPLWEAGLILASGESWDWWEEI